jgi:hypothetical protein
VKKLVSAAAAAAAAAAVKGERTAGNQLTVWCVQRLLLLRRQEKLLAVLQGDFLAITNKQLALIQQRCPSSIIFQLSLTNTLHCTHHPLFMLQKKADHLCHPVRLHQASAAVWVWAAAAQQVCYNK